MEYRNNVNWDKQQKKSLLFHQNCSCRKGQGLKVQRKGATCCWERCQVSPSCSDTAWKLGFLARSSAALFTSTSCSWILYPTHSIPALLTKTKSSSVLKTLQGKENQGNALVTLSTWSNQQKFWNLLHWTARHYLQIPNIGWEKRLFTQLEMRTSPINRQKWQTQSLWSTIKDC